MALLVPADVEKLLADTDVSINLDFCRSS